MSMLRLESEQYRDLPEYIYPLISKLDIPKFAVEFGALDGLHRSNIRKLLENGWSIKNSAPFPVICFTDDVLSEDEDFASTILKEQLSLVNHGYQFTQ